MLCTRVCRIRADLVRFSFFLEPRIPYVVGAHTGTVVDRLLAGTGLRRRDVTHWVVHSGAKKVIDALAVSLSLARHDLWHTIIVLCDDGNLPSGSFLFSRERQLTEYARMRLVAAPSRDLLREESQ